MQIATLNLKFEGVKIDVKNVKFEKLAKMILFGLSLTFELTYKYGTNM